ncbi:nucleotide-diphospho-sugar transferase [Olivibacter domesticus]|uniref:nucleotide-diphospho-sugar transferase n=1 Tax=Olivibacter domesticus TaxID=407022 RepID=UPI00360A2667
MKTMIEVINYTVKSPVLFLNFNRPDLTFQVFQKIRAVKPSRLYIAFDGPRQDRPDDLKLCREVRKITEAIDWDCNVERLYRTENLGCKAAVSSAISWFFEQEIEGIILEDDCLPEESFFYFCDQMLTKYRYDTRVFTITGTNLQDGKRWGNASYYFSQYSNIWGWATWRRVWENYDANLAKYNENDIAEHLNNLFSNKFLVESWMEIFKKLKAGEIDTWDYQLNFYTFFGNGLCITPNVNLISNIGFRSDATHVNTNLHYSAIPIGKLDDIIHPIYFTPNKAADYYFLSRELQIEEKMKRYKKDQLLRRRIKRWFKKLFT